MALHTVALGTAWHRTCLRSSAIAAALSSFLTFATALFLMLRALQASK
jgi:hypothetical protein